MSDTPESDRPIITQRQRMCKCGCKSEIVFADFARRLERERDMYQRQADYLVDQLGKTQIRMIDAERICNKIYIARNISLSEKCIVSALAEIDKTYRTKHDGN